MFTIIQGQKYPDERDNGCQVRLPRPAAWSLMYYAMTLDYEETLRVHQRMQC